VKRGNGKQSETLIKYEWSTVLGGWIKTGGGAELRVGMKYFPVHECIALFTRPDVARAEAENFPLDISREEFWLRDVPRRALSFG